MEWDAAVTRISESPDVAKDAKVARIQKTLLSRGFSKQKDYLLCVAATNQTEHRYAQTLAGYYFLKGRDDADRPCYQGVTIASTDQVSVVGLDRYIHWNASFERWEMGSLTRKACIAFAGEDCPSPMEARSWKILRGDFGSEPAAPAASSSQDAATPSAASTATAAPREEKQPAAKVAADAKDAKPSSPAAAAAAPSATAAAEKSQAGAGKQRADSKTKWDGVWHSEKIWKYEDSKQFQESNQTPRRGSDLKEIPAHWPPGAEIYQGKWASWLPDDWGQCILQSPTSGKYETKFISPEGRLVHAKKEVEKAVGRLQDVKKTISWPEWLPTDWGLSTKAKPADGRGNSGTIYITPCETRFFWTKTQVLNSIAEGTVGEAGWVLKIGPPP